MRYGHAGLLSLSILLALVAEVSAQQPGQAAPVQLPAMTPEQQQTLDQIRNSWETDAKSLQSLYVKFMIDRTDNTFKKNVKSYGEAKVLKMPTGYGLKLETFSFDRTGRPDLTRLESKFVCSGMWFYNFEVASKTIIFQRMQNQNVRPDDGPFAFLFGMKASDSNKRFNMAVVQQDKDYTWIKIAPLTGQDQRDFSVAQLGVVNYANAISPKYFPLRIMWREPSGNDVSWDFKEVIRNDLNKVTMSDFTVEAEKKAGWQLREAPPQGASNAAPPQGTPTGGAPRK